MSPNNDTIDVSSPPLPVGAEPSTLSSVQPGSAHTRVPNTSESSADHTDIPSSRPPSAIRNQGSPPVPSPNSRDNGTNQIAALRSHLLQTLPEARPLSSPPVVPVSVQPTSASQQTVRTAPHPVLGHIAVQWPYTTQSASNTAQTYPSVTQQTPFPMAVPQHRALASVSQQHERFPRATAQSIPREAASSRRSSISAESMAINTTNASRAIATQGYLHASPVIEQLTAQTRAQQQPSSVPAVADAHAHMIPPNYTVVPIYPPPGLPLRTMHTRSNQASPTSANFQIFTQQQRPSQYGSYAATPQSSSTAAPSIPVSAPRPITQPAIQTHQPPTSQTASHPDNQYTVKPVAPTSVASVSTSAQTPQANPLQRRFDLTPDQITARMLRGTHTSMNNALKGLANELSHAYQVAAHDVRAQVFELNGVMSDQIARARHVAEQSTNAAKKLRKELSEERAKRVQAEKNTAEVEEQMRLLYAMVNKLTAERDRLSAMLSEARGEKSGQEQFQDDQEMVTPQDLDNLRKNDLERQLNNATENLRAQTASREDAERKLAEASAEINRLNTVAALMPVPVPDATSTSTRDSPAPPSNSMESITRGQWLLGNDVEELEQRPAKRMRSSSPDKKPLSPHHSTRNSLLDGMASTAASSLAVDGPHSPSAHTMKAVGGGDGQKTPGNSLFSPASDYRDEPMRHPQSIKIEGAQSSLSGLSFVKKFSPAVKMEDQDPANPIYYHRAHEATGPAVYQTGLSVPPLVDTPMLASVLALEKPTEEVIVLGNQLGDIGGFAHEEGSELESEGIEEVPNLPSALGVQLLQLVYQEVDNGHRLRCRMCFQQNHHDRTVPIVNFPPSASGPDLSDHVLAVHPQAAAALAAMSKDQIADYRLRQRAAGQ